MRYLGGCLGRFRIIFGHVGEKMASKRDKMATKKAKMVKLAIHASVLLAFWECGYIAASRGCGGP